MKPFNLDEFKQGRPAVTRDGGTARFVYHCPDLAVDSRVGARIGSDLFSYCEDGRMFIGFENDRDLVGLLSTTRKGYVSRGNIATEPHGKHVIEVTYEERPRHGRKPSMNDFTSVLWRRLASDFRLHAGWRYEDMEKHFREIVRRTLEEYPPAAAPEDDVCGLCGKLGPDKRAHPVHWPGERVPTGPLVHAECEDAECARASAALTADQRKAFLDTL